MKNLVILGGGYGGMRILQKLIPNQLPEDHKITLVDRVPYHCLKTEYYALAAGTISDQHVRVPFPEHEKLTVQYGTVTSIDLHQHVIHLAEGEQINYDDLIIGLGCENKYHQIPGAKENSLGIQTIDQARQTYQALNNLGTNQVVGIVGAGLSGVELASELHESRPDLHIKLFDRGKYILSAFPERLSKYVENWFHEHEIEIINGSNITKVEPNTLYNNNDPVSCDVIVWTAGIQPNGVILNLEVEKDRHGRIVLTNHHNIPGFEHVFVVGDCASLPHAPSAQLAEGQADQIVEVLTSRWNGLKPPSEFPPIKLKGVLGSLGKKSGFGIVADRPLIGKIPRLLKSGLLWMYKHHNG